MTEKINSDHLFIYINFIPVAICELGEAADMRLDEALQHIIDSGMFGEFPEDTQWYQVFQSDCIKLLGGPESTEELLEVLYGEFKSYETECKQLLSEQKFTEEHRKELSDRLRRYRMAKKLADD